MSFGSAPGATAPLRLGHLPTHGGVERLNPIELGHREATPEASRVVLRLIPHRLILLGRDVGLGFELR